ncbi:glycosyltransferase family 2 protein [Lysobacter solisilvae (ex Woo and Kim 2020)]|uniref:Glycosyltransferase family 2 protein n=1 Tax=Agrilutibacter terrestris TaxID=2865112 RepID=A0A7H0FXD1_9GAMM|nr:glycosyltransferase family 2 protein [Lysobacter terrestris]QNP40697.1 glycosyltransferase family 2 protein [Lysobacter terrestris]
MYEILLWGAILLLAYIYVGYPVLAIVLARLNPRPIAKAELQPSVTVVIAAYNEEKHIAQKIRNVLELDYPKDRIGVIVASDASSDATDRIVLECGLPNARLLRVAGRLGKTACQNAAAEAADGEILLFTDATTQIEPHALRAMVANFNDPSVGCVAGRLAYVAQRDEATSHGGTSYWNYEIMLRMAESSLGSLIGVSGCLYAIRRDAYRDIPPGLISDFVTAMVVREQGLRTVLEPEAVCYEDTLDRPDRELSMRVRVGVRSLVALAAQKRFLDPLRFGAFAWQLWSHKLLRYLSPVFWMIALAANIALALQGRYGWMLLMQLALLVAGLVGFTPLRERGNSRLLAQPYYFLLTNLASAVSLFRFLRGERMVTWTPLR